MALTASIWKTATIYLPISYAFSKPYAVVCTLKHKRRYFKECSHSSFFHTAVHTSKIQFDSGSFGFGFIFQMDRLYDKLYFNDDHSFFSLIKHNCLWYFHCGCSLKTFYVYIYLCSFYFGLITSFHKLSCTWLPDVKIWNLPVRSFLLNVYIFCPIFYLSFPTWQPCTCILKTLANM